MTTIFNNEPEKPNILRNFLSNLGRYIILVFVVLGTLLICFGAPVLEVWIKVQLVKMFW